jgi:hypothetical protein
MTAHSKPTSDPLQPSESRDTMSVPVVVMFGLDRNTKECSGVSTQHTVRRYKDAFHSQRLFH